MNCSRAGANVDRTARAAQVNEEIVFIQRVRTAAGEAQLKQLIQDHVERTGEARGRQVFRR